jgi:ribosome-binding protein aMBF1 (putative translation factor)
MINRQTPHNEIDDYIATLTDEERQEVAIADAALELASLLYQARQERDLSQTEAGKVAGFKQQMVSRLEHSAAQAQLSTLQRYLSALGYSIDITVKDTQTGVILGQTTL